MPTSVITADTRALIAATNALQDLPRRLQRKAVRPGLRAGAKIIANGAMMRAPVDSGLMRKSIAVRAGKRSRNHQAYLVMFKNVEAIKAAGAPKTHGPHNPDGAKDWWYPAIVEFKTGPAFMRPAFDHRKDRAQQKVVDSLVKEIAHWESTLKPSAKVK